MFCYRVIKYQESLSASPSLSFASIPSTNYINTSSCNLGFKTLFWKLAGFPHQLLFNRLLAGSSREWQHEPSKTVLIYSPEYFPDTIKRIFPLFVCRFSGWFIRIKITNLVTRIIFIFYVYRFIVNGNLIPARSIVKSFYVFMRKPKMLPRIIGLCL